MKKVKKTSYKQNNVQDSSDTDIKKFFIILVVLTIVIVGLYFLSSLIVKKRDNANNNTNTNVTISYDTLNVGMIFNRPYDEYYVITYDIRRCNVLFNFNYKLFQKGRCNKNLLLWFK